ncbi:MAG: hypothetical protein A2Y73_09030 [Chloroflexi bacterium RBG_13_56_8]|nr:MAG: hypothetical protein A2Y73_09030 [Chloroflexi bacterium RBG_13_56_8]
MMASKDSRRFLIERGCDLMQGLFKEKMAELRAYFETLEGLIKEAESNDIFGLQERAQKLPETRRGAFWQWEYPYYWEQVFVPTLRSSFIAWAFAILEDCLDTVCTQSGIVAGIDRNWTKLDRSRIKSAQKFLSELVGFDEPAKEAWDKVGNLYRIRNKLVHEGGRIKPKNSKESLEVESFVQATKGISISSIWTDDQITNDFPGQIEVDADFCRYALDTLDEFVDALHAEQQALCNRFATQLD